MPRAHLTITVGRDAELKEKLASRLEKFGERARLLGWTNQMPRLMLSHHLVVTKAGGATVQEAIAGRCPMILNQVIPGQEDGNAELVRQLDAGAVAEKSRERRGAMEEVARESGESGAARRLDSHRGTGPQRVRVRRAAQPVVRD